MQGDGDVSVKPHRFRNSQKFGLQDNFSGWILFRQMKRRKRSDILHQLKSQHTKK